MRPSRRDDRLIKIFFTDKGKRTSEFFDENGEEYWARTTPFTNSAGQWRPEDRQTAGRPLEDDWLNERL